MSYDLIIRGGEVVRLNAAPELIDIAVTAGKIAALLTPGAQVEARASFDARGLTILPGLLDVHLHLGSGADISRPRKPEDAALETAGAVAGGVTTIIPYLMGTQDYSDEFDEILAVTEAGARADFSYHPIISTPDQLEKVPEYIRDLGLPTFKIFMSNRNGEGLRLGLPDIDDGFLFRLAQLCAEHGGMICPHPENVEVARILRENLMAEDPEGVTGLVGWNASRPPMVEAEAIQRSGFLAGAVGAPIYFVHTSSALALEAALQLRRNGVKLYIESCPQYLTHDVTSEVGLLGKVNPPLRTAEDRERLWTALAEGDIDTIATDHVHRSGEAKVGGIWKASPGFPGVETVLPVLLSEGHHKRGISLGRIVEVLAENPAKIMGLWGRKGAIAEGFDADFALVDLQHEWTPKHDQMRTSAGFTLYDGVPIKGRVKHTFLRGEAVVENFEVLEQSRGRGQFLKRRLEA